MRNPRKIIGSVLMGLGIIALVLAIIVAFNFDFRTTPYFIYASIGLNTVGILLIRGGKKDAEQ